MEKRQVTMHDGRYLIFYTFEEMPAPPSGDGAGNDEGDAGERQPDAKSEAEEERRV